MGAEDWYRNTAWGPQVKAAFEARLARSRAHTKPQYLRIQASCLAPTHPQAALDLLERYFALGDNFDHAQAHVDRSEAHLALGRIDDAIEELEAALAREAEAPGLLTQAYLRLPELIVNRRLAALYPRALEVLSANSARPTFPADHYAWNGCRALVLAETGRRREAQPYATAAMAAAAATHSGFRHHPTLGLVARGDTFDGRLRALVSRPA